jgi:hypothetical protein
MMTPLADEASPAIEMKIVIGQVLRIVGMIIEFWGIYSVFGSGQQVWAAEGFLRFLPMVALVLGFAMWIIGTLVIYQCKQERKRAASSESRL